MGSLRRFANFLQANSTRILIGLTLGLLLLCAAIKSAKLDAELSSWIQRTSRVEAEMSYVSASIGDGQGSSSHLLVQAAKNQRNDLLTPEALMVHLEALAIATHVSVNLYDVDWSLKDLCFTPTLPNFDMIDVTTLLDRMMPCVIKTPLDCFWEGSKLLGPDQPAGPFNAKWTSLSPLEMVETEKRRHPHASFPYDTLIDWMRRVGITTGYQHKPCLDPTDPNCPTTAPNKFTNSPVDVKLHLTGGCRGFASNQMHWKEEEIIGGIVRNKSGYIAKASGLQSTIEMMREQDLYDYWRKTKKVEDINNWSAEKAKLVLDLWQQRFKQELDQFTRTSSYSSSYEIHAMTSKSMLEPIDVNSLLDLTNFELCFAFMTIFTCIAFPAFRIPHLSNEPDDTCIGHTKMLSLALITSLYVGLTFIASLGLSSFMNLPFNMATTQILPPLALYYSFNQFSMIANIYSQKLLNTDWKDLTAECLTELISTLTIESIIYITALLVTTIIPVPATRVFAFQAITHIALSTLVAIILVPSIVTSFLVHQIPDIEEQDHNTSYIDSGLRLNSPCKFTIGSKRDARQTKSDESIVEEQDFSRILENDLKMIGAESRRPTNINFSASLNADGLHTSLELGASHTSIHSSHGTTNVNFTNSQNGSKQYHSSEKLDNFNNQLTDLNPLPDLIMNSLPQQTKKSVPDLETTDEEIYEFNLFRYYSDTLTSNRTIQLLLLFISLGVFIAMLIQAPRAKYGLQLSSIVAQGTEEYESFLIQEKNFPVYNVFAVTKGNFDYPNNQKLLHEYYRAIEQVDGILRDEDTNKSKFWLISFREWLLEIQNKFDIDRSNSAISRHGWTSSASDASKLAYKLLSQTGKVENPIDKSQVETNRLVDANGIINPKAFYYYLSAWVINDAFSYATSEAHFKPEPKIWNDNPDDLKIERAKPITYAQIPFTMKLPANYDSLKTIIKIRSISQAFEQLNLPNFPNGVPFIFWDQFINLDLLLFTAIGTSAAFIFIIIGSTTSSYNTAAIITIPITITALELYCFVSYASIPFNNILAVLIISTFGIATVQTVPLATHFEFKHGDIVTRTREALKDRFRIVLTSLSLFFICLLIFNQSRIDFMIKYSSLLFTLTIINSLNSLLLTPVILCIFGSTQKPVVHHHHQEVVNEKSKCSKSSKKVSFHRGKRKIRNSYKKRGYTRRVQSELSLSTISEEPQSEAHVHDLKFDLSIRCY